MAEWHDSVSRRRVLQAAAAILPLDVGSRIAAALTPFTTQHQGDGLLALGAREAVTRIASGDITAEAYVARVWYDGPTQNLDERGFTGAVLADQCVNFAGVDVEIHGVENAHTAIGLRQPRGRQQAHF